jgi:hypothetical protein
MPLRCVHNIEAKELTTRYKIADLTAVTIWIVIFWFMTLCDLVGGHQRFEGTYHLQIQSRIRTWKSYVPPKRS